MKNSLFFTFLFGILFEQKVVIIGQISIGEIIAIIYIFFHFFKLNFTDFETKLLFYTFLILLIQFFSDLYNGTDLDKILKGLATYIVFFSTIVFLCRFLTPDKNFKRVISFVIGTIFGKIIIWFFTDYNYFFFNNPWKWGIGAQLITFVLIFSLSRKEDFSKLFLIIFSLIIAYFSLVNNSRSLLLIYMFALGTYLLVHNSSKWNLKFFNKKTTFMFLPLIYMFFTIFFGVLVTKINPNSQFSSNFEKMAKKNFNEGKGSFGVAVNSRSDLVSAFFAIKDKPIIGHGSYPVDVGMVYKTKQFEFLYDFGYIKKIPTMREMQHIYGIYIPSHSYLFGSMVMGGIFAGIYWFFLTFKITKIYANYSNYLPFIFHYWIINYFYALFVSPFGAGPRGNLEVQISILILYILSLEGGANKKDKK